MPTADAIAPAASTTTRATGLVGATSPAGLVTVFSELLDQLAAMAAASTTGVTSATGVTTPTLDTTTSAKKTTVADETTVSTDLTGALAVMVQGTPFQYASADGLPSPAGLGARASDPAWTAAIDRASNAGSSGTASGTAATADGTAAAISAAAQAAAKSANATDDSTLFALAKTAADGTSDGTSTTGSTDGTSSQANGTGTSTSDTGLVSLVGRHVAGDRHTPNFGKPADEAAAAASTAAANRDAAADAAVGDRRFQAKVSDEITEARLTTARTADVAAPLEKAAEKKADPDQSASDDSTATTTPTPVTGAATTTAAGHAAETRSTVPTVHAVPLAAVADTIASHAAKGVSRFDIRLDPADLGRVDVRVEVGSTGEVRAHLVVERPETLDMMLRDQRNLERSLSNAGLDVGSSGLQFSLRDQGGQQNGWTGSETARTTVERTGSEEQTPVLHDIAAVAYRSPRIGGLDLRV